MNVGMLKLIQLKQILCGIVRPDNIMHKVTKHHLDFNMFQASFQYQFNHFQITKIDK